MSWTAPSWTLCMPMELPQSVIVFLEPVNLVGTQIRDEKFVILFKEKDLMNM